MKKQIKFWLWVLGAQVLVVQVKGGIPLNKR